MREAITTIRAMATVLFVSISMSSGMVDGRAAPASPAVGSGQRPGKQAKFTPIPRSPLAAGSAQDVSAAAETFYFAEGYTGSGFDETIVVFMPNQAGRIYIDLYPRGHEPLSGYIDLPAATSEYVDVNGILEGVYNLPPGQQVSARVALPYEGVAERTIFFTTPTWHGSTDLVGVTSPSLEWDFAEGSTLSSFSEFLTLQNPDPATAAHVVLDYLTDPPAQVTKALTLPAASRTTVEVFKGGLISTPPGQECVPSGSAASCGVGPGIGGVSVRVTSDQPIIAERPFYLNGVNFGAGPIRDAHDSFGATGPGTQWSFAEGTTASGFKEYLTVENPGAEPALVDLDYVITGSRTVLRRELTAAPQSRTTVEVWKGTASSQPVLGCVANGAGANCGVGRGVGGVSVLVTSSGAAPQPIVVERPMYMVHDFGSGPVAGAHDVVGATAPVTRLGFSALSTYAGDNDYLTIENQNAVAAQVTITYYNGGLNLVHQQLTVGAQTRATVETWKADTGSHYPVGVLLRSDQPIVVEKPTYSSDPLGYGATDTLAFSPPNGF